SSGFSRFPSATACGVPYNAQFYSESRLLTANFFSKIPINTAAMSENQTVVTPPKMQTPPATGSPWYRGVTPYQWLILGIASAGWIFDVYEGQTFVITRGQMLSDVLHVAANDPSIKEWGDKLNGLFLLGGTFGGILFGWLADRFGRRPMMAVTILIYSLFA